MPHHKGGARLSLHASALTYASLILIGFPLNVQAQSVPDACPLESVAKPLYDVENKIHFRQLANGLQVRTLDVNGTQAVSIASQFDVGSRDEKLDKPATRIYLSICYLREVNMHPVIVILKR